jgi:hypothetical protein
MAPSVSNQISSIQKSLDSLKLVISKHKTPKKIEDCTSKKQLSAFTVKQLTEWLERNNVSLKKTDKKYKKDLIKLIWKNIEEESSSSDDSSSDSSEYDTDSSSSSDSSDSD